MRHEDCSVLSTINENRAYFAFCYGLQPLQSINLAQERTAAEMDAPQRVNSSGTAQPTADVQTPAAPAVPAPAPAPAFSASNFNSGQPVPSYAQLQQLHIQLLQAQQLHAQQLAASLTAQQQPANANFLAPAESGTLPGLFPASLPGYPASYQQLLASLAGSQGLASGAPANNLPPNTALLGGSNYPMAGAPPLQFPANMPWPSADLSQMWATAQQQAALQQAAAQQAGVRDPSAGLSLGPMQDGMSGFTSQQPPTPALFLGLNNGALPAPAPWGWGNAQVGDTFAGGLETAVNLTAMAHNPFVSAQGPPVPGSASMTGNPYQG